MMSMDRIFKDDQSLYFYIRKKEDFAYFEKRLENEKEALDKKIQAIIDLEEYDEETIQQIEQLAKSIPESIETSIVINDKQANLKYSDLYRLIDLEEFLEGKNINLLFGSRLNKHTLYEVINAQNQIDEFSNALKSLDASPFEKYLIIYDFLTNKIYKESNENPGKSRDIVSILNGDNIVCLGYARLMKRLCDEVGIECYIQSCVCYSEETVDHGNNIVRIKDEKYGIDGLFYADACWDSIKKEGDNKTYSYCLIPLDDKNNFVKVIDKPLVEISGDSDSWFFYNRDTESLLSYKSSVAISNKYDQEYGEIDKSQFNNDFINKDKRVMACKRLKGILEDNNIPADIFKAKIMIPDICSIGRMLALCMEENIDKKRLDESIKALKDFMLLGKNFYRENRYKGMLWCRKDIINNDNIFEKIDMFERSETDITEVFSSAEELLKQDAEVVRQMLDNTVPKKWKNVLDEYAKIHQEREIKKYIQQMIGKSENVSLNVFKEALFRSYKLKGMDSETAKNKVIADLSATIMKSNEMFNESAQNCFKQAASQLKPSTNDNNQMER